MITRVWRGWTTRGNADAYQTLLLDEVVPGIVGRSVPGFLDISVGRRDAGAEVEFITILFFDSLDDIKALTGPDFETAVIPPERRQHLSRFDAKATHYEVRASQ